MSLNIKSKKVLASVMALSIVSSGVISSEANVLNPIVPTNTISASAATNLTYQGFEYRIKNDNTIIILKYNGNATNVVIPEKINNITVTNLTSELFKNNTNIISVTIPKGVTEISMYCFKGATNLNSVTIKGNVTEIKREAFRDTKNLKKISLPKSVNIIEREAFAGSGLESIKIQTPNSANEMKIEQTAFASCTNLKTVELPDKLKKLEMSTFINCSSLTSINFPTTLYALGSSVFEGCSSLKSVTLPNSITILSDHLFSNCTSLENINVSNIEVFGQLLSNHSLSRTNLSKINNETIVSYRSPRYSPVAEPIIKDEYYQQIQKIFDIVDDDRIAFFEEYLSAEIRYIVKTQTSSYMTDMEKLKALHDWVCNKVEYDRIPDPENPDETIPNPSHKNHVDSSVFMNDRTVCDGYARALTLLLNEAGIEAYYLESDKNEKSAAHAWCMVKIGKNYYHVDACHDDGERIDDDHFLVSDTYIKLNCPSHENWRITKPSDIYTYTKPATIPACPYTVGAVNMDERTMCAIDEKKNVINAKLIQKYLLKQYKVIRGWIYIDGNVDDNGQPIGINDETILDYNYDGTISMLDVMKYYLRG